MNRRHQRTLDAIFATPTPATLEWARVESLFHALGADIVERAGSRVGVALSGARATFHRPHPRNEIGRRTTEDGRDFLTNAGVKP